LKVFPTLIALLLHPARLTLPLNFSTLLANSFYKFENFANNKKKKKITFKIFKWQIQIKIALETP